MTGGMVPPRQRHLRPYHAYHYYHYYYYYYP